MDDAVSRISYIADDSSGSVGTHLEEYGYQGLGTILSRSHPQTGVNETTSLDDLGRISEVKWGSTKDDFTYGYDADGNVTSRNNALDSTQNEAYTYDSLNQLTGFNRNSGGHTQTWSLDQLGNITGEDTDYGGSVTRTHNAQNQTTSLGAATLAFDSDGNTVTDDQGQTYVYDAWNRMKSVTKGGTTYDNAYDALGRRTSDDTASVTDIYYDASWQDVEETHNLGLGTNNPISQNVWSLAYIDALVLRDRDADANGATGNLGKSSSGLEERIYAQQDANWNVTAITDSSGTILERYIYDAYGKPTSTNNGYTTHASTSYAWVYLNQGLKYNWDTQLYANRMRDRSVTSETFLEKDPTGYAGGYNLYQSEGSAPLTSVDIMGTSRTYDEPHNGWTHRVIYNDDGPHEAPYTVDFGPDGAGKFIVEPHTSVESQDLDNRGGFVLDNNGKPRAHTLHNFIAFEYNGPHCKDCHFIQMAWATEEDTYSDGHKASPALLMGSNFIPISEDNDHKAWYVDVPPGTPSPYYEAGGLHLTDGTANQAPTYLVVLDSPGNFQDAGNSFDAFLGIMNTNKITSTHIEIHFATYLYCDHKPRYKVEWDHTFDLKIGDAHETRDHKIVKVTAGVGRSADESQSLKKSFPDFAF